MLALHLLILAEIAVSAPPAWKVDVQKDAMTDAAEVNAYLQNERGRISFLCSNYGGTQMLVVQPVDFLGGRIVGYDIRDTLVRFDSAVPTSDGWKYHDRYATPYDSKMTNKILAGLESSTKVTFRLETYDRGFIDLTFETASAADALRDARKACLGPISQEKTP